MQRGEGKRGGLCKSVSLFVKIERREEIMGPTPANLEKLNEEGRRSPRKSIRYEELMVMEIDED